MTDLTETGKMIKERLINTIRSGTHGQALKAIDTYRDYWPEDLPEFVPRSHYMQAVFQDHYTPEPAINPEKPNIT